MVLKFGTNNLLGNYTDDYSDEFFSTQTEVGWQKNLITKSVNEYLSAGSIYMKGTLGYTGSDYNTTTQCDDSTVGTQFYTLGGSVQYMAAYVYKAATTTQQFQCGIYNYSNGSSLIAVTGSGDARDEANYWFSSNLTSVTSLSNGSYVLCVNNTVAGDIRGKTGFTDRSSPYSYNTDTFPISNAYWTAALSSDHINCIYAAGSFFYFTNTPLQNDNELCPSLNVSTLYSFEYNLNIVSPSGNQNMVLTISGPSNSTGVLYYDTPINCGSSITIPITTTPNNYTILGFIRTVDAGNLNLMWTQETPSNNTLIMISGSSVKIN